LGEKIGLIEKTGVYPQSFQNSVGPLVAAHVDQNVVTHQTIIWAKIILFKILYDD
jgi:hypothetical protein